ncbi:MAG: hypothetical protein NTX55_02485 [Candidatus Parcubacteria bacterium]|nr:hypothetical protein [Candidatus Parcubacteria bacterium]
MRNAKQKYFAEFNDRELKIFKKLSTPKKIQDFLEKIPINFDYKKDTCMSPRMVLQKNKAHCIEAAIFSAAAFLFHGQPPLLLDLKAVDNDYDHVVALFKKNGRWGAISKTNHAVLRYREPIYRDIRELALSFFHEYFDDNGKKTLRSFSRPLNLLKLKKQDWLSSEKDLWHIVDALYKCRHYPILTRSAIANLRRADPIEIKAGKIIQWKWKRK